MATFVVLFVVLLRLAYVTELDLLKRDLTFPRGIRAAVVGDSRVEVCFDPEEIPWLKNCGLSATPFEITAQRAKLVAELNPELEVIIVDIWPDRFLQANEPFSQKYQNGISLIEIMTRENMPPLGSDFPMRLSSGLLKPGLKHFLGWRESARSQLAGAFLENHRFLMAGKWAKLETYVNRAKKEPRTIPTHGEQVLMDLLDWMRKHNRKVVLITTPLYDLWWRNCYSLATRTYFESRMKEISEKYGVRWYNWLHEYQENIDFWGDGNHLNFIGAKRFSRDKRQTLESELASPK